MADLIGQGENVDTVVTITYFLDGSTTRTASRSFTIPVADVIAGIQQFKARTKFDYSVTVGRRAITVRFEISNNVVDASFGIKSIAISFGMLTEKFKSIQVT